jgi:hypothetical protein
MRHIITITIETATYEEALYEFNAAVGVVDLGGVATIVDTRFDEVDMPDEG